MNDILNTIDTLKIDNPLLFGAIKFGLVLLLAILVYLIVHKVLIQVIKRITKKTKTEFDDILLNEGLLTRASYIIPIIVIRQFNFFEEQYEAYFDNVSESLVAVFIILIINSFIDAFIEIISKKNLVFSLLPYVSIIYFFIYILTQKF